MRRIRRWLEAAPHPAWAERALERIREAGEDIGSWPDEEGLRLARVLGASAAVGQWMARDPEMVRWFRREPLEPHLDRAAYLARMGTPPEDGGAFMGWIRRSRNREMVRIVARECLGIAPVEVTAAEVSALAEAVVELALNRAWRELVERHGEPRDPNGRPVPVCVLGMGKLAGRELNLSSDVDLVFLYGAPSGSTCGGPGGAVEVPVFFGKLVSRVTEILGRHTPEGFVFRVDLDLRPEGRNGPPAQPVDNAVLYYQSWGQTWERAVLMRARPIAGDLDLGRSFLREVEPFVYRRSLDYTTVEDLKEMKHRIDRAAARRLGSGDDIKLGRGGIREVEFFVQTLQLIHGGRMPDVRSPSTLESLARLERAGVIDEKTSQGLARCYRFLRTLEHGIQALHFRQTHRLPSDPAELRAVARRMGFGGDRPEDGLLRDLDDVRSEVHASFGRLMHGARVEWEGREDGEARELLSLEEGPEALERLREAGFRHPEKAWEGLRLLRDGPGRGPPSPRARRVLSRIAPRLLAEVRLSPDPDRALMYLGEFVVASGARASYLTLLEENPATVRLLVQLFGTSDFLSRYVVNHPELLDELVLGTAATAEKSREEMEQDLEAALARARDEEEWLDALRRFRHAEFLRIAVNDLWGTLEPEAVTRQITRVAETCLEAALGFARERLRKRHGTPCLDGGGEAGFCVLGLGKLGGEEIDYHSDLDVLFIYEGLGRTSGPQPVSNPEFFARVAQRLMSVLSTRTREGFAFRIDARLRPSGRAGPLVASLGAFEDYHRRGSQLWERQALLRLRPVAGEGRLGARVRSVVDDVLFSEPPSEDPRPEIHRMRGRIEREVAREEKGRIDIKAGPGGLVDVEFAVQALQLLYGWREPGIRVPNTLQALAALGRAGLLPRADLEILDEGYRFLRRVEARLRVLMERPTDVLPHDRERLEELARGLGYAGGGDLVDAVREHRSRVRDAYRRIMGA